MWLHIPKTSYPSTQVEEDSTLDLSWLFPMLEQSVMWREKSRQSQSWSRALKTNSWMMPLFGQIPQPSMANLGLEKWIGSLEDSPANHGQLQEKEKEKKTKDGFGMTSSKSLCRYDQKDSSWKTFQVSLLDMELTPYSESFPKWGSMQNGEVLEQEISVPVTEENEYSSWLQEKKLTADSMTFWATPKSFDQSSQRELTNGENVSHSTGTKYGIFLSQQATQNWTTPTATNISNRSEEAMERRKKFRMSIGRTTVPPGNLSEQVTQENWMTPTAYEQRGEPKRKDLLGNQVKQNWATPTTMNNENYPETNMEKRNSLSLGSQASMWGTPNARDWKDTVNTVPPSVKKGKRGKTVGMSVAEALENWQTPNTRDTRRGCNQRQLVHDADKMMENWQTPMASDPTKYRFTGNTQASNNLEIQSRKKSTSQASHQAQTQKNGKTSSENTQDSPQPWKNLRLNPMFVEWLMGWPLGYTELTDLEYSEMESYHFKQRMHLLFLLGE